MVISKSSNKKQPRSEYTHFKTTKRDMYDAARQRAGITYADPAEVLVIDQGDGSVMEGTFTTPYFWRNGRWVTPPVAAQFSRDEGSGGQDGTSRRWALERGLVFEQAINAKSLVHGEECWISNGVRGFVAATIRLH
ncbi:aminodeoxychorismate lyase [Fusarium longipes]|uniref:Aminodeoxychorismate lyase n=1 Tax=Fusarium longipes TaxID=694270 RepID=A0A395RHL6_9HYPO|nr:aminodeoxychorismate lyase [Fusarium longipes]